MKISVTTAIVFLKKSFIRYYSVISVFVALVVLSAGYAYIISPKIERIKVGGTANLRAKQADAEELRNYLRELQLMQEEISRFSDEDIETLRSILPGEEDIPGLFVQIQEIAEKNSFMLGSVNISSIEDIAASGSEAQTGEGSAVPTVAKIGQMNIAFVISGGGYEEFKSFLSDIERNIRLFDIYDINFGSASEGPFSINLRTYYIAN